MGLGDFKKSSTSTSSSSSSSSSSSGSVAEKPYPNAAVAPDTDEDLEEIPSILLDPGHDPVHKQEFDRRLFLKVFLQGYGMDGEWRGEKPPGRSEVPELARPGEDGWDEHWIDATGDWEHHPSGHKMIECECGQTLLTKKTFRRKQCWKCARSYIDFDWTDYADTKKEDTESDDEREGQEDDGDPNMGLRSFMGGVN